MPGIRFPFPGGPNLRPNPLPLCIFPFWTGLSSGNQPIWTQSPKNRADSFSVSLHGLFLRRFWLLRPAATYPQLILRQQGFRANKLRTCRSWLGKRSVLLRYCPIWSWFDLRTAVRRFYRIRLRLSLREHHLRTKTFVFLEKASVFRIVVENPSQAGSKTFFMGSAFLGSDIINE